METVALNKPRAYSRNSVYLILLGLSTILIGIGLFLCESPVSLLRGIEKIILHPSMIDFDSFYWAGDMGAPFVQSGLCTLITLFVYRLTKTKIMGSEISIFMMVLGFSFYGKNIINMWFPVIGVYLYAKVFNKKASSVSAMAFASTCLGPIFSVLAFNNDFLGKGSLKAIIVGGVVTIIAGFFTGLFAEHFHSLHKDFVLYNAGMAATWAAIILYSLMKAIGIAHEAYPYNDLNAFTSGNNVKLGIILVIIFAYLIIVGLALDGQKNFSKLFLYKGREDNHIRVFGTGACLMDMGVVGIVVTLYILALGGDINGTAFAAIFAAVGFTAFGSTPRTHLPVLIGVFLGAFLTGGIAGAISGQSFLIEGLRKVSSRGMLMSALFACGVAPIVCNFGDLAGIMVGIVHSMFVVNVPPLHGWMSLYNNGFSLGLITTLLYPAYCRLSEKSFKSFVKRLWPSKEKQ